MRAARERNGAAGFTLVEMLVSMAVLVLLILLVERLFTGASIASTLSSRHIEANETARIVFGRMAGDFSGMVERPDVNYIFYKQSAAANAGSDDTMFFYSEAPAYLDSAASLSTSGSGSGVALTGYRINTANRFHPGIPVLERLGERLTWAGTPAANGPADPGGMVFLHTPVAAGETLAGNWATTIGPAPYTANTDTLHYQVLDDQVFRLEICFLLRSGTYSQAGATVIVKSEGYSNTPTAIPYTNVPAPYVSASYFGGSGAGNSAGSVNGLPPDLAGIVVTIAVLDKESRKMLGPSAGTLLENLGARLPDSLPNSTVVAGPPESPQAQLPAVTWQQTLLSLLSNPQGDLPPPKAIGQVRVYEHLFYLQPN